MVRGMQATSHYIFRVHFITPYPESKIRLTAYTVYAPAEEPADAADWVGSVQHSYTLKPKPKVNKIYKESTCAPAVEPAEAADFVGEGSVRRSLR